MYQVGKEQNDGTVFGQATELREHLQSGACHPCGESCRSVDITDNCNIEIYYIIYKYKCKNNEAEVSANS